MKPPRFEYLRCGALDEAVALLAEQPGDAKVLAGGQSLIPLLNLRLAAPTVLVDITRVPALDALTVEGDAVRVGAAVRQRALERSADAVARVPLLADALRQVAHVAIRSRGTVCGSLAHADPAAELPVVAVALDAELVVAGPSGRRVVAAADFFRTYYTTALEDDEILVEARLPTWDRAHGSAFLELARRHGDFAIATAAAVVELDGAGRCVDARVALGGVADVPVRCREAEAALAGAAVDERALRDAARLATEGLRPHDDVQLAGEDRRRIAATLTRRALEQATSRARSVGCTA